MFFGNFVLKEPENKREGIFPNYNNPHKGYALPRAKRFLSRVAWFPFCEQHHVRLVPISSNDDVAGRLWTACRSTGGRRRTDFRSTDCGRSRCRSRSRSRGCTESNTHKRKNRGRNSRMDIPRTRLTSPQRRKLRET